jgi:hypothetical protein
MRLIGWIACFALLSCAQQAGASPRGDSIDLAVQELGADHDRATKAIYSLQAGGASAAKSILDAWPSLPLLAQKRAIAALRPLSREHSAAVDALVLAARADDPDLQQQALAALRQSPQRGRTGLVALLDDPRVGGRAAALLARSQPDFALAPLLEALAADGGADRTAIRDALSMAVERADNPKPSLGAWLGTEPPHAAAASAAFALSTIDAQEEMLASFIVYALPGSDEFATAWRLLQSSGSAPPHPSIDRWLATQLAEPDAWMLRAAAVDAVTARGGRAHARPSLSDSYPRVRMRAAIALSGDAETLIARATLARKDTWPMVRAAAVTSLRSEADALPVIVAAVNDGMSLVRVAAIEALTPTSHDEGWEKIHGRLRATNEWPNVTAAAIGYARIHCRSDAAESLFRVVLRAAPSHALTDDLNNAALAIEALRALGTPEAQAFVEELRVTPEVPPTLKMALGQPMPDEARCPASSR